jgi:hypothetical protein
MEAHTGLPGAQSGTVSNPKKLRSRVTNGRSQFVEADGRGPWARRFRDILDEILSDIGVPDSDLSQGQRQMARRAATLACECEKLEGESAAGRPIDLNLYGTLVDRIGRAFARLATLKRTAQTSGSTFGDRQREYHERQRLLEREQRERERAAAAVKAAEAAPAGSTEALAPDTGLS